MRKRRLWEYSGLALLLAFVIGVAVGSQAVLAESSSSKNYQMVETEFGAGTANESCSSRYCAKTSLGEVGSGSRSEERRVGKECPV